MDSEIRSFHMAKGRWRYLELQLSSLCAICTYAWYIRRVTLPRYGTDGALVKMTAVDKAFQVATSQFIMQEIGAINLCCTFNKSFNLRCTET